MNMNLDAHKTTWVSVRLESSIWTIWTQIRARFIVYSLICEPLSNLMCSEFTRKLNLTKYHITVWSPLLKRLKQWQMWYEIQNEKHLMKLVKTCSHLKTLTQTVCLKRRESTKYLLVDFVKFIFKAHYGFESLSNVSQSSSVFCINTLTKSSSWFVMKTKPQRL